MKDLPYRIFFKAFANKTRFEIIDLLRKKPKTVTEISSELGFEQSRVSHNMAQLVDCGFVVNNQIGKNKVYSLDKQTIVPLLDLIDKHIGKYSAHLKECGILEKKR